MRIQMHIIPTYFSLSTLRSTTLSGVRFLHSSKYKKNRSRNGFFYANETSGIRSTLRFGPRLSDVHRTSSAPVNYVVRSSIPTMSDIKKRLFKRGIFNETSGIRTPDNLIKSQVLYHLS